MLVNIIIPPVPGIYSDKFLLTALGSPLNNNRHPNNPILKTGKGHEYTSLQRRYTKCQQVCEKVLKITNHQEIEIKTTTGITSHLF